MPSHGCRQDSCARPSAHGEASADQIGTFVVHTLPPPGYGHGPECMEVFLSNDVTPVEEITDPTVKASTPTPGTHMKQTDSVRPYRWEEASDHDDD